MKSRTFDMGRNHEALWMEAKRADDVLASKGPPHARAGHAAQAQTDAFLHQDAFECAFQEAEALSHALNTAYEAAAQTPPTHVCADQRRRPMGAVNKAYSASAMRWDAWRAARAAYERSFMCAWQSLQSVPAAMAAARMPPGGLAMRGPLVRVGPSLPARPSQAGARSIDSQLEQAWRGVGPALPCASKPQAQPRVPQLAPKDRELKCWPPRSRL